MHPPPQFTTETEYQSTSLSHTHAPLSHTYTCFSLSRTALSHTLYKEEDACMYPPPHITCMYPLTRKKKKGKRVWDARGRDVRYDRAGL
jgi:hypothetical protein